MEVFITAKTKVSRVFQGVKEQLDLMKDVTLIGFDDGSGKVVAIAEKIKGLYQGIDQENEIFEKDGQAGIRVRLKIV
jgi:hypothetical protein